MDGAPSILALAHAVLCAPNLDEAQLAFAALCLEDLDAARGLEQLLNRAVPQASALWAAIIDHAAGHPPAKPWRWHERDAADTANAVERHLRGGPGRVRDQ